MRTFHGSLLSSRCRVRVPPLFLAVALWSLVFTTDLKSSEVVAEFDVAPEGDMIIVPVSIGGKQYPFCIDTGSPVTVIDRGLRPMLGPRIDDAPGSSDGSNSSNYRFSGPDASLGPIRLKFPDGVQCRDYTIISDSLGLNCYGNIGMDVLQQHIMQVDFDRGKLRFLSTRPADAGRSVRISFVGPLSRIPTIAVSIPGAAMERFAVATGAVGDSLWLRGELFDALAGRKRLELLADGNGLPRSGWVDAVQIGDLRNEFLLADASESNVIGLPYLSRYTVTFDFPHAELLLKEGRTFREADVPLRAGENAIERKTDGVEIHSVDAQGAAGRLGLNAGDIIERINGRDVRLVSNWYVYRALGRDDRPLTLVVRRGNRKVALTLSPIDSTDAAKRHGDGRRAK